MVKSQFRFEIKNYTKHKYQQNYAQIIFCIFLTVILLFTGIICLVFFKTLEKRIYGIISLILTPIPLVVYNIWIWLYIKKKTETTFSKDFVSTFCFYNLYFTHEVKKNGETEFNRYEYTHLKVSRHKEYFALEYEDKENGIYFDDSVFFENIVKGDDLKLEKTFREQGVLTL